MRAFTCLLLLPVLAACSGRPAEGRPATDSGGAEAAPPAPPAAEGEPAAPAPAPQGGQLKVEITARRLQGDDGGGRVTAEGGAGTIAVQGSLSTPNPCYGFQGTVRRDGSILTLTVEARSTGGICVQSIGAFAYDATVRGVPAGTYTFRVVHTYPDTGWESRGALETSVTVS